MQCKTPGVPLIQVFNHKNILQAWFDDVQPRDTEEPGSKPFLPAPHRFTLVVVLPTFREHLFGSITPQGRHNEWNSRANQNCLSRLCLFTLTRKFEKYIDSILKKKKSQNQRNREWNGGYQGLEGRGIRELLIKEYKLPVIRSTSLGDLMLKMVIIANNSLWYICECC